MDEDMWLYEDEAGRPLLATRRTPGLGDVGAVLRREEVDGEPFDAEMEILKRSGSWSSCLETS